MKVVAILASYNEEFFISACLDHYFNHGVEVFLIDNESTDSTVKIAENYLGKGLIGIEILKRRGYFDLGEVLKRKEELIKELDADWFIHADIDEIRIPHRSDLTLAEAIEYVDKQGYNAINFMEFTFLPTEEEPNHEKSNFQETMKCYYPFAPKYPHRINAFKKQQISFNPIEFVKCLIRRPSFSFWKRWNTPIDLSTHGGHIAKFKGLLLYPQDFKMKHYLCLSLSHAIRKYCRKDFKPSEIRKGWHRLRSTLKAQQVKLPSQNEMRRFISDDELDRSNPLKKHLIFKE